MRRSPLKARLASRSVLLGAAFATAVVTLSSIGAIPTYRTRVTTVAQQGPDGAAPGAVAEPAENAARARGAATAAGRGGAPAPGAAPGLECRAGRNGGGTDTGVTASSISIGATVVRSGIGSSFLGGAPVAMQALTNKVNREGGICGRLLDLRMVDDGWSASEGVKALRALVDQGIFAITVSPSSEGVNELIKSGDVREKGVPLVGADGMVKSMYRDPWVWPVASSTVSTMHIIVEKAYAAGARSFGIVFAKDYKFGVEGALAFSEAVKRKTGHAVPGFRASLSACEKTFCGILSGQGSYNTEVERFTRACQQPFADTMTEQPNTPGALPSCDLIAYLLEPKTALNWLQSGGPSAAGRVMGPQPLFNADFAKSCGAKCQGWQVWTSYTPPLPPYDDSPAVREYVQTVRQQSPSLDVSNAFTQGAYLGMKLFVEAARRVGPRLTREGLRQVLDSQTFDLGLTKALSWRPGRNLGTGAMLGYTFQYQGERFIGFRQKSNWLRDPWLGQDL